VTLLGAVGAVIWSLPSIAHANGTQFQVNTDLENVQARPDIGSAVDGSFVVVWRNFDEEPVPVSRFKIQGRVYGSDGSPTGPDAILDGEDPAGCYWGSPGGCRRDEPSVAVGGEGDFVVVWRSAGFGSNLPTPGPFSQGISGRRFTADGTPLSAEFVVRPVDNGFEVLSPDVAIEPDGGFVVAWTEDVVPFSDSGNLEIFAQRYDPNGVPSGPTFQVNGHTLDGQMRPTVAGVPGGGFLVVWQSRGSAEDDSSGTSIQARRYDASGVPTGPDRQVNSFTTGNQLRSAVGVGADGDFMVVWESWGSSGTDGADSSIQARRFTADGTAIGPEFQVNRGTEGPQQFPAVAVEPDGDFLVAWWSSGGIWARAFDAEGTAVGPDLPINSTGVATSMSPAVAAAPGGDYVVAWASDIGSSGDFLDAIEARRVNSAWIFLDAFETGDITRWTASAL
jgi:hypothetical protein